MNGACAHGHTSTHTKINKTKNASTETGEETQMENEG